MATYTVEQVAEHKDEHWLVYKGKVYNMALFVDRHPGGLEAICKGTGKDATGNVQSVTSFDHEQKVDEIIEQFCIGTLQTAEATE